MDFSQLRHKVAYKSQTVVEGQGHLPNAADGACSMTATPKLGRYQASFEAVPLPWKKL